MYMFMYVGDRGDFSVLETSDGTSEQPMTMFSATVLFS